MENCTKCKCKKCNVKRRNQFNKEDTEILRWIIQGRKCEIQQLKNEYDHALWAGKLKG